MIPQIGLRSPGDAAGTARLAQQLASEGKGKCVCVIVNTVRQAQRVYQELELPMTERKLKITQLLRDEALPAFKLWQASGSKTDY